jgi:hypothetical protein
VPAATDCLLPSGRVISMLLIGKFQRSTGEVLDAETRGHREETNRRILGVFASLRQI